MIKNLFRGGKRGHGRCGKKATMIPQRLTAFVQYLNAYKYDTVYGMLFVFVVLLPVECCNNTILFDYYVRQCWQ